MHNPSHGPAARPGAPPASSPGVVRSPEATAVRGAREPVYRLLLAALVLFDIAFWVLMAYLAIGASR